MTRMACNVHFSKVFAIRPGEYYPRYQVLQKIRCRAKMVSSHNVSMSETGTFTKCMLVDSFGAYSTAAKAI